MSGQAQDIPVTYINKTGSADVRVVVYETNVAWHVLIAQTQAEFVYPASTGVGAYYTEGNLKTTLGPFPAQPGSTWEIDSAAILKKGASFHLLLDQVINMPVL